MLRLIFIISLLLVVISCKENNSGVKNAQKYYDLDSNYTDYLISFYEESEFTPGISCGYKNLKGEIIIPIGKYSNCFTDTFKNFAFVYDSKLTDSKIIAIDRNENILFEAYMCDNGPDYLADGLFRIIRDGKIGYADNNGIVIIAPKYECAEPFKQGIARVTFECKKMKVEEREHSKFESNSWFLIDKMGNRIK
jgi:hypothetical protein